MSSKLCSQCGQTFGIEVRFCPADGTPLNLVESTDPIVGTVIADRFHILDRIGEGGMGRVYLAEHVRMGRKCAVKMINPAMANSADAITRFNREAANASRINHPNVAQIYDFGETSDGLLYLAMEFIEGESLSALLARERALPIARAADLALQAAHGLAAAHHLGIVHRDLKPDNILVAKHVDGSDWVKVVDFGIAKTVESGSGPSQTLTTVGVSLGTPEYMSPEQLAGEKLDHRTDIYSLGLVLFNTLTADLPYPRVTSKETLIRRLTTPPQTLAQVRPDREWSASIQRVLDRALASEQRDRFATANDFGTALTGVIAESHDPARTQPIASVARTADDAEVTRKAPLAAAAAAAAPTVRASAPTRRIPEERPTQGARRKPVAIAAMVTLMGAAVVAASVFVINRSHSGAQSTLDGSAPQTSTAIVDSSGVALAGKTDSVPTAPVSPPPIAPAAQQPTAGAARSASAGTATAASANSGASPKGVAVATTSAAKADSPAVAAKVDSTVNSGVRGGGMALAPGARAALPVIRDSLGRVIRPGRAGRNPDVTGRNGAGGRIGNAAGPPGGTVPAAGHPWLAPNGDSLPRLRTLPPNPTDAQRLQYAGEEVRGHVVRGNTALRAGDVQKARNEFRSVAQEMAFARTYFGGVPGFPAFEQLATGGLRAGVQACLKAQADSLLKSAPPNFKCESLFPGRGRGG